MRNFKDKTIGILGAIIIHLIAGIIFMLVQLGTLSQNNPAEMLLEFEKTEEIPLTEKKSEVITGSEGVAREDEDVYNIARNIANQNVEKINIDEYIDKVKDELIQSGKLGVDNYIDEQKKNRDISDNGETAIENQAEPSDSDKTNELEKMASDFTGPTRVYYNLPGRYHTYLPIPIYKCEGSGKVTLTIEVNPIGEVTKAEIITAESSTSEECLVETAVSSAFASRFNPDANALKAAEGTLTFEFVAQ
jgi:hypothetical protein